MTSLLAGLMLGVAGSLHCAAMCGPLVIVARTARTRGFAVYQAGRILVYCALGALAGYTGQVLSRAHSERVLAIGIGIALMASALGATARVRVALAALTGRPSSPSRTVGALVARATRAMPQQLAHSPFVRGLVNGFLPCGLLYAALTAAVGLGSAPAGLAFIVGFGLGTTPGLAAVRLVTYVAGDRFQKWPRVAPIAVAIVGLLLVLRGIYVSAGPMAHLHGG